jgi:hypothetical protein
MEPVAARVHVTANDALGNVYFNYSNRSAPNPELRHFERGAADRVKCSAMLQAASCPDIFFGVLIQSLANRIHWRCRTLAASSSDHRVTAE